MIEWLNVAAAKGPDAYIPLWRGCMEAAGGRVELWWDGVWPVLKSVLTEDLLSSSRAAPIGRLVDHMRLSGYRFSLLREVVGDSDGTRPGEEPSKIGSAVGQVVEQFLSTGGRILIEPDGAITDAHDRPVEDDQTQSAASTYRTASCCPRAVAGIRQIVETLGTVTPNSWVELRAGDVTLEMAFFGWKKALSHLNALGREGDEGDDAAWALLNFSETILLTSEETGPRAAEAILWLLLSSQLMSQDEGLAPVREDVALLVARRDTLNFEADLALRALEKLSGRRPGGEA
jgi:hypothetical protein